MSKIEKFEVLLSDEKAKQGKSRPITRLDKAPDGVYWFVKQTGTINANKDKDWAGTNGVKVFRSVDLNGKPVNDEKPVAFWAMFLIGIMDKEGFTDSEGSCRVDLVLYVKNGEVFKHVYKMPKEVQAERERELAIVDTDDVLAGLAN